MYVVYSLVYSLCVICVMYVRFVCYGRLCMWMCVKHVVYVVHMCVCVDVCTYVGYWFACVEAECKCEAQNVWHACVLSVGAVEDAIKDAFLILSF